VAETDVFVDVLERKESIADILKMKTGGTFYRRFIEYIGRRDMNLLFFSEFSIKLT
jgi:hypothetical protein